MENSVLKVNELCVQFQTSAGLVTAINNLSFELKQQETLCLVGESGSGKSVTALTVMGLLPKPAGIVSHGTIELEGQNLLSYSEAQMQRVRGNKVSMIFQEPMTTLNPVYKVGDQICEALLRHRKMTKKEAMEYAGELLNKVRIADAKRRLKQYPHELSGGLRQRVMISMALACNPKILIADEPTTALDVTVQAQVLRLLEELKEEFKMSVIFITHDLGVVSEIADRIIVMYGGMKMEEGPTDALFSHPVHPYTKGLINCTPKMEGEERRLPTIPGMVPSLAKMPKGCHFCNRCTLAKERCMETPPKMTEYEPHHYVACYEQEKGGATDAREDL